MNAAMYVRRHFRQVRRTFFLCILTCASFMFISFPVLSPMFDRYNRELDALQRSSADIEQPVPVYAMNNRDVKSYKSHMMDRERSHMEEVRMTYQRDTVTTSSADIPVTAYWAAMQMRPPQIIEGNSSVAETAGPRPNVQMDEVQVNQAIVSEYATPNVGTLKDGQILKAREIPTNMQIPPKDLFLAWRQSERIVCDNSVSLYYAHFARFKGMHINKQFCIARAKGGEEISNVLRQDESAEYYTTMKGCLKISCPSALPFYHFSGSKNYMNLWLTNMQSTGVTVPSDSVVIPAFTIAVVRQDYVNIYWQMNDWYATFLMMNFFNKTASETNILLVDAHPKGNLDSPWSKLFNSVTRMSELPQHTTFSDFVWGLQGYNSMLVQKVPRGQSPPLMEEFRRFFLSRFGIDSEHTVNCSREVSVLFVWRRDYLAHPRNPKGIIQRKIANEQELLDGIRNLHPTFKVEGVQLDQLTMDEQLKLISKTDVLIGMHGAGLAHVLMMPEHGVMIEMFPLYYAFINNHFADLARWRGVGYIKWSNFDTTNERPNYFTALPLAVVDNLLTKALTHVCAEPSLRKSAPLYTDLSPPRRGRFVEQFRIQRERNAGFAARPPRIR